jgi:hypothetical protein
MTKEVSTEGADRLLNVNATAYLDYLIQKYRVEPLTTYPDKVEVTTSERPLPGNHHGPAGQFSVVSPGLTNRPVVTFHLPVDGERALFWLRPSTYYDWQREVKEESAGVAFDVFDLGGGSDKIQQEAETTLRYISELAKYSREEVEAWNVRLTSAVREIFSNRRTELLRRQSTVQALKFPLRRSESTPRSFTVPIPPKRTIVQPPSSAAPFTPEPTIDQQVYTEILSVLNDVGRAFERLPSAYLRRGEEDLRDQFLVYLGTNCDSATGETFNRQGKTDILIRHQGKNLFIAECKFWGGEKAFLATIDQALSYLTWRDSKAAILSFVKRKNLQPVLEAVAAAAPTHPCFLKERGCNGESWFNYEFRLPADETRSVQLAVMCFHFPEDGGGVAT